VLAQLLVVGALGDELVSDAALMRVLVDEFLADHLAPDPMGRVARRCRRDSMSRSRGTFSMMPQVALRCPVVPDVFRGPMPSLPPIIPEPRMPIRMSCSAETGHASPAEEPTTDDNE
jgi:hypothetical protein